jgi:L-iditol 2-dehydrogenase
MKALVLKAYNQLVYQDVEDPRIASDEVLLQVKACGICGSDVHGVDGSTGRRVPPIIMGHEASGVIVKKGADVNAWHQGDRVTFDSTIYPLDDWYTRKGQYNLSDNRMVLGVSCDEFRRHGAFAEYVSIPQHVLSRIPENVSFDQAAAVEPAAVAMHAVRLTPLQLGDTAVVIGTGIIGLFIVQVLRASACQRIIAVDIDKEKLALAATMGADLCLQADAPGLADTILEATRGRGADAILEAVGLTETVQLGLACVRKGGAVTLVGNVSPKVELPLQRIVSGQLRLQGSCAICGEYPLVLDMIESGAINVNSLISARAPLAEGAAWFDRLKQGEKGLMKVILNP